MTISSERFPNTFIAGAPKAGTSSIHRWIADHPHSLSSIEKETYFLVDPGTHMYRAEFHASNGLDTWGRAFPDIDREGTCKVILESTPSYIYSQTALEFIPRLKNQPKCLFVVREPSAQIYSIYTYFRDNWSWVPSDMTFTQFVNSVREGSHDFGGNELAANALSYARYVDYLLPWLDRLGPDRMRVVTFDRLVTDRDCLIKEIAAWFGLDPAFYNDYDFPAENETYRPRNRALQKINVAVRGLLPKGKSYNALRHAYRKINTARPHMQSTEEAELLAALSEEFADANLRLSRTFDLELGSTWKLGRVNA